MAKQEPKNVITFGQAMDALQTLARLTGSGASGPATEAISTLYNFLMRETAYLSWAVGRIMDTMDPTLEIACMILNVTAVHADIAESEGERMLALLKEMLAQASRPGASAERMLDPERN